MNKSYTNKELEELREIQSILTDHRSVFSFPPEVNRTLTAAYWNMLKSLNVTIPFLEEVFQSFIGNTPRYPSIMEVKEEIQCNPAWVNPKQIEKTYDIISVIELNNCQGDTEMITRKYISGLLFHKCNKNEMDIFIKSIIEHREEMPILYELSYLKLLRQGVEIESPIMTFSSLWELSGIKPMRRENFDIHKYINSLSEKMAMGGSDGK
jgi:hypothetical protein